MVLTVEGEDYNLTSTVITFPDTSVVGDTACAALTIIDDSILELDEEFRVQITTPTDPPGVTINVTSSTTVVTIEDNKSKSSVVNKFRLVYNYRSGFSIFRELVRIHEIKTVEMYR